ncbi:protein WVD2-like 2 [Neltuma alba]|uniref:protein WVD2-like 2 n=1 Tax=Neltuma alba TaxID=207710 RepID=UPI0010A36FF4|nr:protein WVD2-like 2 [Prosopis alba]
MGREVTGIHVVDTRPNRIVATSNGSSNDKVHVSPRIAGVKLDTKDHEVMECTEVNSFTEKCHEKKDVSSAESTHQFADWTEKNEKSEAQTTGGSKKLSSPATRSTAVELEPISDSVPLSSDMAAEKNGSDPLSVGSTEAVMTGLNMSPNANNTYSPNSTKHLQTNSPFSSRKFLHHDDKKHHDDDDNWSLASSAASARTARSRVTVGSAPTFRCSNRAEKRKEFYLKLEEKHRALEEERNQYKARQKEEEEAAIKQLRKNLVIRANPVPSFYYEGPPPKVELKKLPLTRPKSPKLTRRKSSGDAISSSSEVCSRQQRHSLGSRKEASNSPVTPKTKEHVLGRKSNGSCEKSKVGKETKSAPPKIAQQTNADISVH